MLNNYLPKCFICIVLLYCLASLVLQMTSMINQKPVNCRVVAVENSELRMCYDGMTVCRTDRGSATGGPTCSGRVFSGDHKRPLDTGYEGSSHFFLPCQHLEYAAKYNATNQLEASFCSMQIEVVGRHGEDCGQARRRSYSRASVWRFCILCWTALTVGSRKVGAAAGGAL